MEKEIHSPKQIFDQAVAIESPDDRRQFLEQACSGDAQLHDRVEKLLVAYRESGSFLESPPAAMQGTVKSDPITEGPGTVIGNYKLMEQIGEGGMGMVFVAEQLRPVRRKVALKVIKPGMDTRDVIARFEAERQALALMDHPHIARVLDAGATDSKRPFFVMELVRGVPITEYCDQNQLTTRERLELFVTVCHAIQHAHHKGIIHRDVKPGNVLVTLHDGSPVVKVIDFGVAKAIGQQLTERTIYTRFSQMIGTPLYMSPEQAEMSGLDVDTRSDVYSLGVLLYELLTGTTPFDKRRLREAAFDEVRRIIREEEPPRPSLRISTLGKTLTTVATHRKIDPGKLSTLIRGDLDWIVMKALEKDRTQRYETTNGLARDVQRYLIDEPVTARPPSATYRFNKFARRNKGLLTTILAVVAVLLVGIVVSTTMAMLAFRAEKRASDRFVSEQHARGEAQSAEKNARDAEREAKQNLFDSYLAQARASRLSGRPGQRLDTLAAVRGAARLIEELNLKSDVRYELRNHVIGALGLVDVQESHRLTGLPPHLRVVVSSDQSLCTTIELLGTQLLIRLRQVTDPDPILLEIPTAVECPGYGNPVFSSDNRYLAVTPSVGKLEVWDLTTTRKVVQTDVRRSGVTPDFSPQGQLLAVARGNGELHVFDLSSGKLLHKHSPSPSPISSVKFSPDGKRIAVARSGSGEVDVRELATGNVTARFPVLDDHRETGDIAWHPDGQWLAIGYYGEIGLWNVNNQSSPLVRLRGHESWVKRIEFCPSGELVVSSSWDNTTRIWNAATGDEVVRLSDRFQGLSGDGQVVSWTGNEVVISEIIESEVCDWLTSPDVITSDVGDDYMKRTWAIDIEPDGQLLAVGFGDGVRLWDLDHNRQIAFLPIGETRGVAFGPDGELFTSGRAGVFVWPIQFGESTTRAAVVGPPREVHRALRGHGGHLSISDNGRTVHSDNTVVVRNGTADRVLRLNSGGHVALSPDGDWAATAPIHRPWCSVWNVTTGKEVCKLTEESARPVFSPDGRWLATNSHGHVRLWRVDAWERKAEFTTDMNQPGLPAFSPDGKILAIEHKGYGARLLALDDLTPLAEFEFGSRPGLVNALCFTPKQDRMICSTETSGICKWELRPVRERLNELNLDWDQPPLPLASNGLRPPLKMQIELGVFGMRHYVHKAESHVLRGEWQAAADQYEKALETGTTHPEYLCEIAAGVLIGGKLEAYRRACRTMFEEHGNTENDRTAYLLARAATLGPKEHAHPEARLLASLAVEKNGNCAWYLHNLGMACYREGEYAEAVKHLEKSAQLRWEANIVNWIALAMAYHHLGDEAKLRQRWQQVSDWPEKLETLHPHDRLAFKLLRDEATQLLSNR